MLSDINEFLKMKMFVGNVHDQFPHRNGEQVFQNAMQVPTVNPRNLTECWHSLSNQSPSVCHLEYSAQDACNFHPYHGNFAQNRITNDFCGAQSPNEMLDRTYFHSINAKKITNMQHPMAYNHPSTRNCSQLSITRDPANPVNPANYPANPAMQSSHNTTNTSINFDSSQATLMQRKPSVNIQDCGNEPQLFAVYHSPNDEHPERVPNPFIFPLPTHVPSKGTHPHAQNPFFCQNIHNRDMYPTQPHAQTSHHQVASLSPSVYNHHFPQHNPPNHTQRIPGQVKVSQNEFREKLKSLLPRQPLQMGVHSNGHPNLNQQFCLHPGYHHPDLKSQNPSHNIFSATNPHMKQSGNLSRAQGFIPNQVQMHDSWLQTLPNNPTSISQIHKKMLPRVSSSTINPYPT